MTIQPLDDRYQICDPICEFISSEAQKEAAFKSAKAYQNGRHERCGQVIVYDLMAHVGQPQKWDAYGSILERRAA